MPLAKKGAKTVQKDIKKTGNKKSDEGMVDANIEIDESERFNGTVKFFERRRGFGFITLDKKNIVPEDQIMIVWKDLVSNDRWPFLDKEMKVEFNIKKFVKKNGEGAFLKAVECSLPSNKPIDIQAQQEDKKEYVGGDKNLRYTGSVVWYDWKKGFGYVKIEDGYDIPTDVPKEIRVHREEICTNSGESPHLRDGMEVEFGISKNAKDKYAIYNLTLPGGDMVTRAAFENRKDCGNKIYNGTIRSFMGGFGWIEPEDVKQFPAEAAKKLKEMTEKRSKRSSGAGKDEWIYVYREDVETDIFVDRGQTCKFKIHLSDKGVGANTVQINK